MAKRLKRRAPKKIRRNPLARVLAGAKYRPRIVKAVVTYKRRPKHRKVAETIE